MGNLFGSPRRNRTYYLEGADWAEFDDLVNDVLDRLRISANVYSVDCVIRRGDRRRVHYGSVPVGSFGFYAWDRAGHESDFQDYCGEKAPRATVPYGTPGGREVA